MSKIFLSVKGSSIIWLSFNLPTIIYLLTWHPMACAGISRGQKLRENFQTRFIFCSSRFYKIFSYILSICLLYSIMLESQILSTKLQLACLTLLQNIDYNQDFFWWSKWTGHYQGDCRKEPRRDTLCTKTKINQNSQPKKILSKFFPKKAYFLQK